MARLLFVIHITGLQLAVFCSASFAAPPLMIAELEARRGMAEADAESARAEREMAAWRLGQLQELRDRGHASWQEVAQQQVALASITARLAGSEQYLEAVLQWQARVAKLDLPQQDAELECIRLYSPGSVRLVAWLPADVASRELLSRHLEDLSRHHEALLAIDLPSARSAVAEAQKAVEIYRRLKTEGVLLNRAQIRSRLTQAKLHGAIADRAMAEIVARRIASVRQSLDENSVTRESSGGLSQLGTRFVGATSGEQLSRLVEAMATDHGLASARVTLLEHQRVAAVSRVDALKVLLEYSSADRGEFDLAKQLLRDLDLQIQQAHGLLDVQRHLAGKYEESLKSRPTAMPPPARQGFCDDLPIIDANVVRHFLDLQQRELVAETQRADVNAKRDYLVERRKRVERIPEPARAPWELEHLDRQLKELEGHLAIIGHDLVAVDRERRRFQCQLKSQKVEQYQLVQAADGALIGRAQFELAEALVAAVGFVGQADLLRKVPAAYPYIESTVLLDCLSRPSMQSPVVSTEILSRHGSVVEQKLHHRVAGRSISPSALRLATDGITFPETAFCELPYASQAVHPGVRWTRRRHTRLASSCGFRTFNPYETYPFGSCGQSILSYRCGFPTRSSFPYRSDYLYRTAFPAWKDRTIGVSEGFRGARWQSECCFD